MSVKNTKKGIFGQKKILVKILKKIIFWSKISFFVFKTNGPDSPFKNLFKKYNILYIRRHMVASKGVDQKSRFRNFWS